MAIRTRFFTKQFLQKLNKEIDGRLHKTETVAVNDIKSNTPVITGKLKKSIEGSTNENEDLVVVGTDVEYAKFVEFGTRKMQPRFFMTNGIRKAIPAIRSIFSRRMN